MKGKVTYDKGTNTEMTIHFIRDEACAEYIRRLDAIQQIPVPDLSRLKEDAFYNWKVVPQKKKS